MLSYGRIDAAWPIASYKLVQLRPRQLPNAASYTGACQVVLPCLATQHAIATRQPNYTELRDTNNATVGLGSGLRAVLEQSCESREWKFGEKKR